MVTESMMNCRKQRSDDGNNAVWLLVETAAVSVAMAVPTESVSPIDCNHS